MALIAWGLLIDIVGLLWIIAVSVLEEDRRKKAKGRPDHECRHGQTRS